LIERHAGPAAAWRPGRGYSFIEIVFVAGLVATMALVALPTVQRTLDEFKAVGATRYLAGRLARARIEALARSTDVALRFVPDGLTYRYGTYIDGNANGVRSADIVNGIDRLVAHEERLPDQFSGVDLGVLPGLPAVDGSTTPPGTDPVKLGSGSMATFTPDGTATPGSLYVIGPHAVQLVVRIVGETGRTRILKFDARRRVWKPL
jgi:type II secretory pathway pseudopilin PulG